MGSFRGHVLPGTLFLVVGIWHIWSSIVRYVVNPNSFKVRVWNPVLGFQGKLWYLELYIIAVGAFVDMCIELLYSPHLKFFVNGELNPSHMNDFEHAGMLLMFFLFGAIALLSQHKTRHFQLPEGALSLVAATAFCSEYLLFSFHSTSHKGLEGYYHLLLVLLISVCVFSAVTGALFPTCFSADLCTGVGITLQGIWFYQTAFTLYGPMMPDGCRISENSISCRSHDTQVRGELLANVQFFSSILLTFAGVAAVYAFAISRYSPIGSHHFFTRKDEQ